ncbi:hypothetical protein M5689_000558 [Euphorbia peplus]|nr:hypothetical protein M5689_000558 [Euphorbia peplus]
MMAKKKKQGHEKVTSTENEATKPNLWPDLPQKLINIIATDSSMMKDLYSKGVTKSWRTESRKCRSNYLTPPWLLLSADYESDDIQPHTFNIPFKMGGMWYWCRRGQKPTFSAHHFLGCSNGLLIKGASDYILCEPYPLSRGWWSPSWNAEVPYLTAAVLDYPFRPESRRDYRIKSIVMVLTGISHPAFVYYRTREGQEWIKKDSTIDDPHCSDPSLPNHLFRFCNGIWFKWKFYALSLQGTLVVIEKIGSDVRITAIGKRVVPSVASKHYREFMIESGGKILIAFLISRNRITKVDFVEVYELDAAELTWIKKEYLGDSVLFLGAHCCMRVSAKRVGCKRNCIYFSISCSNGWWIYDMETGTISPVATAISSTKFLDWAEPELEGCVYFHYDSGFFFNKNTAT